MKEPHFRAAHHIHFTGIKGVGMTALALCAQDLGISISGSDVANDFVTADVLLQRGIVPTVQFSAEHVPLKTDLLIYTGANQGAKNPEVLAAQSRNIRVLSHAEAVGEAMEGKIGVSVCGVGGKTSTSAMLANILEYANLKPSFVIGVGKVLNLQVPGRMTDGRIMVAEADEYAITPVDDHRPRFTFQNPKIIICTNIAYDHPDVYASIEETKAAFKTFFEKLPSDGLLIANGDSDYIRELDLKVRTVYFGSDSRCEWQVKDSFIGQDKQLITVSNNGNDFNLMLSVPGIFNARNALAAYIAARELGVDHQIAIEGLQLFRGSMRRFEKVGEQNEIIYFDDYAHHPSEISATIKAAREWLPLNRLVVVFQPHTFSRTKALFDQFAHSFAHCDEVIITDIYGAREADDPTVSGYKLAEAVKANGQTASYIPREELVAHLKATLKSHDALFTLGAGEIYTIHKELMNGSDQ